MRRFSILPLVILLVAGVSVSILSAQEEEPAKQTQQPASAEMENVTTVTATITAIDKANRMVTLKGPSGRTETITVPEEFKRFDSLKVGDKITARYAEAFALSMSEPGQPLTMSETEKAANVPGGSAISRKTNVRVQVKSIDKEDGTVTVVTPEGKDVTLNVDDKARLDRLKPGDQINVTYTEALLISVDPPSGQKQNY